MSERRLKKCIKCNVSAKNAQGYKKYVETVEKAREISDFFNINVDLNDFVCAKCFMTFSCSLTKKRKLVLSQYSSPKTPTSESQQTDSSQSSVCDPTYIEKTSTLADKKEIVELPFPRPRSTHKYCFICGQSSNIRLVPFEARKQVFTRLGVIIPEGNRCCHVHLIKKRFYDDEVLLIRTTSASCLVNIEDISKLLSSVSLSAQKELKDEIDDFSLPEDRLIAFTGLNWKNLGKLRGMMTSLKKSSSRTITQAIVVFLFKLRTGASNDLIAAILGLERPQQVSDFSASVLKSFEIDVLPTRFGIQAISRDYLINEETAPVVKKLHDVSDNQLVLIADGTYLRHQKSFNNEYQRKSFSGQKKVPLCKPFTICTTNGYILDTLGPFLANKNDAEILKLILKKEDSLMKLLRPGDVFVLDRGFRDVVKDLEEMQFKVLMPALKGNRKQLTTSESNHSRQVTMIRWVVEAVHGVIGQKYKLLHHQLDNKLLHHAASYCRIACFLVNTFGKRFISSILAMDEVIARVKNYQLENTLAQEAETERWGRRKRKFEKLTSTAIEDFPEITEEDLKIFFTGTYQLQQAISYLAEMINENNELNLYFLKETPEIIRFQVRSRHISSKTYNSYVHYRPNSIGLSGIQRYCCECANGLRTIGCCSHVAAIIFYLSNARYQSRFIKPAEKLMKLFTVEDVHPVINEDSDED